MASKSEFQNPILHPLVFIYQVLQYLIAKALSPNPPKSDNELDRPKIAIIGAGITGVTSAAHCVGHGFDVVIFERGTEDSVGGIWTKVNDTSGLQIHSVMYRFHPSVQWQGGYPDKSQILKAVRDLWRRYGLQDKTRFNFKVEKTYQDEKGRWIINNPSNGRFDGLIAAVGTCGAPKRPSMQGMEKFKGKIVHSSELDGIQAKGKKMAIIGGGASAVEALEFAAAKGTAKTSILSRSDKWIIPRNIFVDTLLSLNIFGQETILSFVPEFLLRKLFYRDLEFLAPSDKGLFMDTPMVNSDVMEKLRQGQAEWIRGDIVQFEANGVTVNRRAKGVPKGGPGHETLVEADIVVLATGFSRPSLSFLPDDVFEEPYDPPNWYLQTFPPQHPSVSAINCTYVAAIGSVGNWHIGIYTRILLMFLVDPLTRPRGFWMRRWIDMTKVLKMSSPTGAFDFFTYLELVWWFVFCVAFNPFRWKWALFVFFGVGMHLPAKIVEAEKWLLNGRGHDVRDKGVSL
ncbi:flavin-binding monooxygenase-like family protein [Emericellopsis atlantica]|uniref:Flavin-binding monooxygenase-like family protein n=1 Tax=Emericellopsis atlantica TaxID=2614577 RepID=A0A9P8CTT2_9HYPO|nr:flavin-binding monooxygenase-like family protein [Emericellopsis atlantica]KAG9259123.1 flavin-binding monooxygenase-like family protein [Emericellopsis atlantica]